MQRFAFVAVLSALLSTACASSPPGSRGGTSRNGSATSRPASTAVASTTALAGGPHRAGFKPVAFHGVRLTVPAGWPVIDGAHARNPCSSSFDGQADRVFLGVSYQGVPSCPAPFPGNTPPPANGVWVQPASAPPANVAWRALPGGQTYLLRRSRPATVTVWYHHVTIDIGIGANHAVERAIFDSLAFNPASTDTAVLGRCPAPNPSPPDMPVPTRLAAPLTLGDHNATLRPEPATVRPRVSAAAVWADLFHNFGELGGPLQWSITFASYSAETPATIHHDGSITPNYRGVPTWLIYGHGAKTSYGPCGITVYAPYNAATGRGMGVSTIG